MPFYLASGIILGVGSASERRRYYVTPPLIGWAHTQNYTVAYNGYGAYNSR